MSEQKQELFRKIMRLQWLLHRYRMHGCHNQGPMNDPSRGQGRVLAILKMQSEISTKELSYLLGIRPQSLNELLAKLEKNGYVSREQSDADKRVIVVKLTEKGRNVDQQEPEVKDFFSCLSEEEQKIFGEYLDRIIENLEGEIGDEPDEKYEKIMRVARERFGKDFEQLAFMRKGGRSFRDGFQHSRGHGGSFSFDDDLFRRDPEGDPLQKDDGDE